MKNIVLLLTLIILTGCKFFKNIPFFDFDNVEHYNIKISESEIIDLEDNIKNNIDRLKVDLILNDLPETINDTLFIKSLPGIGFKKNKVNSTKYKSISALFSEKYHFESYATTCVHFYRDILIFKKENNIIGIAKICFECSSHQIVGTEKNTSDFGQSGDYGRLHKVLYNN